MIVLSLPYLPNLKLKKSYAKITTHIEYRLDYHSDPFSLPGKYIGENSILTLRSVKEGGRYLFSNQQKLNFYADCIKKYNCLVDWELVSYERSSINPQNLIISYHHDQKYKLDFDALIKKLSVIKAKFCKLVLPIDSWDDFSSVYALLKKINKTVLFCGTGRYGKLSRVLFPHLGAVGTYIGDDEYKTHPDQLTISEAELYRLKSISDKTQLGGIIGGKQVQHSLGLDFFNRFFDENHIDARYLPFHLNRFEQIFEMLSARPFISKFFGFSVTMPFKQQLADRFNSEIPLNTYIPKDNLTENTDIDGFEKALAYLDVSDVDRILIVGSGATAISALVACKGLHTFLTARNYQKAVEIANDHQVEFIEPEKVKNHVFEIVINCTPIGMQREGFIELTGIRNFAKFIDLPYTCGDTPVISYCKTNQLPYVDGKLFWQWQATAQLDCFLSAMPE